MNIISDTSEKLYVPFNVITKFIGYISIKYE